MSNPNWSDVLRDDETLLWQGQPEPTPNWKNKRLYGQMGWSVGLLLIVVVALIVSPDARSAPPVAYVFMAALLMFSFVRSWSAWFALRKTRYAVTDVRVLWRRGALVRQLPRAGLKASRFRNTLPPSLLITPPKVGGDLQPLAFEFLPDADDVTKLLSTTEMERTA